MKIYKQKKSNIDKRGLFASRNIKKGTRIIEYKGKIITKNETEKNSKFDNDKDIYLFNLNSRYDLDGDYSWNTARLVNHSCNPNCEVEGKGLKLWITSIKDIKPYIYRTLNIEDNYQLNLLIIDNNCNICQLNEDSVININSLEEHYELRYK